MQAELREIRNDVSFLIKEGGSEAAEVVWSGIEKLMKVCSETGEGLPYLVSYILNLPAEMFSSIAVMSKLESLRRYEEDNESFGEVNGFEARIKALRHFFVEYQSDNVPKFVPGQYFYVNLLNDPVANKLLALECLRLTSQKILGVAEALYLDEKPAIWVSPKGKKAENYDPRGFFKSDQVSVFNSI